MSLKLCNCIQDKNNIVNIYVIIYKILLSNLLKHEYI